MKIFLSHNTFFLSLLTSIPRGLFQNQIRQGGRKQPRLTLCKHAWRPTNHCFYTKAAHIQVCMPAQRQTQINTYFNNDITESATTAATTHWVNSSCNSWCDQGAVLVYLLRSSGLPLGPILIHFASGCIGQGVTFFFWRWKDGHLVLQNIFFSDADSKRSSWSKFPLWLWSQWV